MPVGRRTRNPPPPAAEPHATGVHGVHLVPPARAPQVRRQLARRQRCVQPSTRPAVRRMHRQFGDPQWAHAARWAGPPEACSEDCTRAWGEEAPPPDPAAARGPRGPRPDRLGLGRGGRAQRLGRGRRRRERHRRGRRRGGRGNLYHRRPPSHAPALCGAGSMRVVGAMWCVKPA